MTKHARTRRALGAALMLALALTAPAWSAGPVPPEEMTTATLKPNGPHRFFAGSFREQAFNIFDADSGKLEGSIPAGYVADLAISPDNSQFLVSETYWSHGSRGRREDLVSIWDARTIKLVKEITLPTRALVGGKIQDFQLSVDGSKAYVYVLRPASSVIWLDLRKQAVGGTIEIPGCALVFPFGNSGFSSPCADGSLAVVNIDANGQAAVTHTKPFFDGSNDPVYDNSVLDRAGGKVLFLSYTGLVYPVKLGAEPVIDKPWSIQQAAGFAPAGTGLQELAWRPGGNQPVAFHRPSGRLFVLMHMGTYWTHKQGGTEIWILDVNRKSLIKRIPLQPIPTSGIANEHPPFYASIGVSQDAEKPLIYLVNDEGGNVVMDAASGEIVRKIPGGGEFVLVTGNN